MIKITSFGVELEGGINDTPYRRFSQLVERSPMNEIVHPYFTTDGSVGVDNKDHDSIEILMWVNMNNRAKLLEAVKYLYDECDFTTNVSCGLHIHLKFDQMEKALSLLSYYHVQNEFIRLYKKKFKSGKYQARLTNHYCSSNYVEEYVVDQLTHGDKGGYRYKAINLNSYNLHKTIEIRLMPYAENYEEFVMEISWVLKTVEYVLNKMEDLQLEFLTQVNEASIYPRYHKRQLDSIINTQLSNVLLIKEFDDANLTKIISNSETKLEITIADVSDDERIVKLDTRERDNLLNRKILRLIDTDKEGILTSNVLIERR